MNDGSGRLYERSRRRVALNSQWQYLRSMISVNGKRGTAVANSLQLRIIG